MLHALIHSFKHFMSEVINVVILKMNAFIFIAFYIDDSKYDILKCYMFFTI